VQTNTFALLERLRDGFELRDEQIAGYTYVAIQHEWLEIEQTERTRVLHEARLAKSPASETSPWQRAIGLL
jgi:hypothetical protein